jgi:putative N6-adenine-specific DNA methylase
MSDAFEKRIKKHIIGKPHRFLAVVPLGFEQTLINELGIISVETVTDHPHIVSDGKVEFTAKITEAWKAVAYSRIANRVLMHIADFKAENFRELEKKASEIPWELYLDKRTGYALQTKDERFLGNVIQSEAHQAKSKNPVNSSSSINIHVTCKHSRLYHSDAIAERLQKIIGEESVGGTSRNAPPQNLYVSFIDDRCTIWLDLAGEELYKRGLERFVNDAPLKETIAAAMLFEAFRMASPRNFASDTPYFLLPTSYCLLDLMAGSGTFSIEAAYIANKIIPGICRDFALKHQPAFKEATWNYIVRQDNQNSVILSEAPQGAKSKNLKIITSDISERAIEIIKHNEESSPLASIDPAPINPHLKDFFSYTAKEIADTSKKATPIIVLNPPYGKRLDFDAPKLYKKIGRKLTELAHDLEAFGKNLTVAILAPKDDTREGSKYTCTSNLLQECPALSPKQNPTAKLIVTSHGGFSLNVFIAKI